MGRNAAGESFLKGFFKHHRADKLWAQVANADHGKAFETAARAGDRNEPIELLTNQNLGRLQAPGCVFLPGPNLVDAAWSRSFYGHAGWSLCGITHTTASTAAMDAITNLLVGPVQPWDALICTSPTVKNNVEKLLQAQVDYLQDRLSVQRLVLPQLPVIPLGLHCDDFDFSPKQKAKVREDLGIANDTLVVLFAGRLSFHAKAHPLAMYQALQAAIPSLPKGQKLLLIELGWFGNEPIANAFKQAAQWASPDLQVKHLDGREASARKLAWASADLFCSLSDNLQETFGITPIEAMAAGLPAVVSDWDGYRGSIEHRITGYRVPTCMPTAGHGNDLAQRHALGVDTYDMYCGLTSSLVSVDIGAATEAFKALFQSSNLRKTMGEAGRKKARQQFDWSVVIGQYEALWQGLATIRKAAASAPQGSWPARQDPFHLFASYPSSSLTEQTALRRRHDTVDQSLAFFEGLMKLVMVTFARPAMPSPTELRAMIAAASGKQERSYTVGELVQVLPAERQSQGLRGLAWLLKLGVFEQVHPVPDPKA